MERTIIGIFKGNYMVTDDNHSYPVPPNYASKSRLVVGDILKLVITENGDFIYKQIMPIPRQKISAEYIGYDTIKQKDKIYSILHNSVTYYRLQEGDKVAAYIPQKIDCSWAAVDQKISGDGDIDI